MGRKPGQDPNKVAARKQRIIEAAFPVFAERTIERVTMNDIADACGIGVATVYRHFSTKPALVLAVATWAWESYLSEINKRIEPDGKTAGEQFRFFLDSFLDLYRNHKDLLRFNQFFNIYVQSEKPRPRQMKPYMDTIGGFITKFHIFYALGERDGTLRTDMPEQEMATTVTHLMLAAVTRYAVGLVYLEGSDPEKELILLRDLLLERFLREAAPGG